MNRILITLASGLATLALAYLGRRQLTKAQPRIARVRKQAAKTVVPLVRKTRLKVATGIIRGSWSLAGVGLAAARKVKP